MTESRKKPILQRRDRWGHGIPLWIVVGVAFLIPVMAWALRDLKMHNDVAGWLPRNDPQARILTWYESMFPSEDRVLVSWDSASITDPRLRKLEDKLEGTRSESGKSEGGSPYVSDVTLPTELLTRMLSRDVPFDRAMSEIDGVLIGKGPLKIRISEAGRKRGEFLVQEILDLAKQEFGLDVKVVEGDMPLPELEAVPLEESKAFNTDVELTKYIQAQPLYSLQLSWLGMHSDPATMSAFQEALLSLEDPGASGQGIGAQCIEECFVTPGSLAAVSVSLSEAGIADKEASVAAIREAVEQVGVPADTIHLGGQPIVTVALNNAVQDAGWNPKYEVWNFARRSPILLSAIVSVLFSFVMLRSIRLATLVQAVSFLTVIVAMALIPLSGGTLNMVLIVMPTLLVVLTTSAAIHLSNYWKHSGISDPSQSVFSAAKTAWLPCGLAACTTSVGLASLTVSNLVPVRDFGIYAAIGCLISFVVVLYVLPSLMLYWPRSPPKAESLETGHWNRFGRWLARNRTMVAVACVLLTAAAGWGLRNFETETKVIRYFPEDSRLVRDYVFLEDKLSGVISIDTIVKFDTEAQKQLPFIDRARKVHALQQEIRQHPEISGVLSLSSFLDLRKPDPKTMSRFERQMLGRTQQRVGQRIHERLKDNSVDDEISSMLALPDYATDWKESGDQLLNREGDEVWRITAQTSALSDTDLEVLLGDMNAIAESQLSMVGSPNTGHIVTGLIPVFLRTQQAVLESLIRSFGMAFIVIAIVMMVLLRSPFAGLLTMLPNLMPVILIFGLLSWMELKVDIGTMITASVALGIAVDGTLHLITWFKSLVQQGVPVEFAVGKALEHCGPAMWQTSAAIGFGMLALLPAELLLVSRFGWIMAALIFAALVADVVFLPALLGGTLGRLIQKAVCTDIVPESTDEPQTVKLPGAGHGASRKAEAKSDVSSKESA
ncbi:efflux RND transporter permease subunit [Fuerstiella marisgermanici]|uniref:Efflux transporter, putative, hydrophobe/amphiphile efflux-3 (HAE3) family n=1 Tax=Fuerstiella marisgermanici TaxID=1891926 RepID=A0A1P8WJH7_9PLAN|nr:MMPL family transporter [Fuerstiella marisgermanici]APZ94214.1 efflux transporter, putative, hydrophobe/amphiphile efflux-3 (HAE3) family [Fuerstiella marisgermanici]